MSIRQLCQLTIVLALLSLAPSAARAAVLSDLFQGGSMTVDDKVFRNWTLLDLKVQNGGVADVSQIDVAGLAGDPLNPGLQFNAPLGTLGTPFGHIGPSSVLLRFGFTVETINGDPLIKDNSLWLTDFLFDSGPNAIIRIGETITDANGLSLGTKSVFAVPSDTPGSGNPNHFDSANFAPQSFIYVEKTINIDGPGDNDGAFLLQFEQRFSQVPEPATLVLWSMSGAAAIAVTWWRKRKPRTA